MFKKLSGSKPKACCKYLPFRLQPLSTSNRHMHADIVHESCDICITDVDLKKSFVFKDVIETAQELRHKKLVPHGLSQCNLIAYHWDLAVLQVFYKHSVHVYVCNCSTQRCTLRYVMCPCITRSPGLCEAYFTSDRAFLILKVSEPYLLTLSIQHEKKIENTFIEIVKLEEGKITSNHIKLPNFSNRFVIPFGICAVPESPSEIFISIWEEEFSRHLEFGEGLWSLKATVWLVEVSRLFTRPASEQTIHGINRLHDDSFCLVDTFPPKAIIINQSSVYRKFFAGVIKQCNVSLHSCVTMQRLRPDLTESRSFESVIENFGRKRIFTTIHDGQPAFLTVEKCSLKSLKVLCIQLLTNLLLPEDIHLLPLPQKLKDTLKYGVHYGVHI